MARYKKLINLAKELDFSTEEEYFDYMIDSHFNGNFEQCRKLIFVLCWRDRIKALSYILELDKIAFVFYTDYLIKK